MLGTWFEKSMVLNARRVAVETEDGRRLTYGELDAWSAAVAEQLAAAGVGPGDVVALLLGNEVEFLACDVATARLGAAKLPVNPLLPATTVAHLLDHSGTTVLVVHESLAALAGEALAAARSRPTVITTAPGTLGDTVLVPPDGTAGSVSKRPRPADRPETLGALFYTGGTTGLPKGVRHTHASLVAFHQAQLLEAEIRQQDRLLLTTPLAHAAGLFAQSALLRGATVLLRRGFDAAGVVRAIAQEHVTWTFLVPTMLYRVLDVLDVLDAEGGDLVDLGAVDTIVYGAAPISARRLSAALERFGPVFVQLYGQTECPNWGTRLVKSDHDPARPGLLGSCGQASIHTDVKVVSEAGEDLAVGEVGEICLRGPYVLTGYHGDPDATRDKFLDGWIRTGDVGVLDDAGYLYLKDRRADMVISGGMNVYGKEVEDVLVQHPAVRQVAVIGIPHDDWGEAVHAVVVLGGDDRVGPEELVEWTRGRLAAYARPKSVALVEELPETAFGKIDKVALRAGFWQGRDRAI